MLQKNDAWLEEYVTHVSIPIWLLPGGHPAAALADPSAELGPEHGGLVDLGDDEAVAHHDGHVGKELEEEQLAPEGVDAVVDLGGNSIEKKLAGVLAFTVPEIPFWFCYMCRADRKSQVRLCLGFCTADFLSLLAYVSAKQKPTHCLAWDFPSALYIHVETTHFWTFP